MNRAVAMRRRSLANRRAWWRPPELEQVRDMERVKPTIA
jgi:hypothetical protein